MANVTTPKIKWSDVKRKLADLEKPRLLNLLSDLYALNSENRDFFHARFTVGEDPLDAYKKIIRDCMYPDLMDNEPILISRAKKAISQYKRATGNSLGIIELMVFFVEQGNEFTLEYGDIDGDFYSSLERMFEKAVIEIKNLDEEAIQPFQERRKG